MAVIGIKEKTSFCRMIWRTVMGAAARTHQERPSRLMAG